MLTPKQKQIINQYRDGFTQDKAALSIYPFRYEKRELWNQKSYDPSVIYVFEAQIISAVKTLRFSRRSIVRFKVLTNYQEVSCVMYNRPYFKNTYGDRTVTITGSFNDKKELVVSNLNLTPLKESIGLFPIYPLKKGISQYQLRAIMKKVLKEEADNLNPMIPSFLTEQYQLMDTLTTLQEIHFPTSTKSLQNAIRTLKYTEALRYQMALELERQDLVNDPKLIKDISGFDLESELAQLPFELTIDQYDSLNAILSDFTSVLKMRRLILGDVGSGKTIVALLASKAIIQAGYQVAFLCPTEVLAHQHAHTFNELGIDVTLLTSQTKSKDILSDIESGHTQMIIGTHALFSDDVFYNNLGFVIIDEQHRFGVNQRIKMIEKGDDVDLLMMSATPIPRTLASTIYAHLDLSFIETMPKGRKPVITQLVRQNSIIPILDEVLDFVLNKNQQIYVICPAIDQDDMRSVNQVSKNLKSALGDKLRIGSIHSQMKSETINSTINKFKDHKLDVLVSTTIVEVGVHIENANMMIIYDADRFGLSQLHQLRGRIGRDKEQGYCYVLTESKNEDSLKRLNIFVNETSGFKISEMDLMMRGTGDLLGQQQSGFLQFNHLDLVSDLKILEVAKEDAKRLVDNPQKEGTMFIDQIRRQQQAILNSATI